MNAFICEHCIHDWSARLGPSGSPLVRPSEVPQGRDAPVAEQPPEHAEVPESAIRTASEDGVSVPTVERGETLGRLLAAAKEPDRGIGPPGAEFFTTIDQIVFTDPDHAAVWFTMTVAGTPLLPRHRGDAVMVGGVWKVARSTFCDLMTLAGVQCPPETG
jgi:hypothetical protein